MTHPIADMMENLDFINQIFIFKQKKKKNVIAAPCIISSLKKKKKEPLVTKYGRMRRKVKLVTVLQQNYAASVRHPDAFPGKDDKMIQPPPPVSKTLPHHPSP